MPVYRIDLAYDGTDFHGYARQPGVRTVQGALEDALAHHVGPVETFVAGRTDKGVHAAGQVASFEVAQAVDDTVRVQRSLNRQLGPEVAVLGFAQASDDFHARFSATGRSYRYLVLDREAPDPFLARTAWHYGRPLDASAMSRAAEHVLGEHDFASFCRRSGDRSTIRLVREAAWRRLDNLLAFDVEASSFCHQMVRSLVAVCVEVGRGRVPAEDVATILEARDRHAAKGAAPPHGLTLVAVRYD